MITVSIVEDDQVTRESLAELIGLAIGLSIKAVYPNAEAAMRAVPFDPPDVLLVDTNLPGRNGIECVAALKVARPSHGRSSRISAASKPPRPRSRP